MNGPGRTLEAFGVEGIGEVREGDDVAELIAAALAAAGAELRDADVVVVSSKVVSKAEGRTTAGTDREKAISSQTVRVVAERETPNGITRIAESRSGPVLAAAGVDASNVEPGTVLLLPEDPDASARALRAGLRRATGATVGVVVSDTAGRPWRDGQVDIAIGAAGIAVVDDLRGESDTHGQLLEVTVRAVADELASLGDLVKGKLDGVPAAVLRGLPRRLLTDRDGPGAAALLRDGGGDWFRYGHVEAVQAAAGLDVTEVAVPPPVVPREPAEERFARVLGLAAAASRAVRTDVPVSTSRQGTTATLRLTETGDAPGTDRLLAAVASLGAVAQTVRMLGWTEGLTVRAELTPVAEPGLPVLVLTVDDPQA